MIITENTLLQVHSDVMLLGGNRVPININQVIQQSGLFPVPGNSKMRTLQKSFLG